MNLSLEKSLLAIALAATLTACGGSSGGASAPQNDNAVGDTTENTDTGSDNGAPNEGEMPEEDDVAETPVVDEPAEEEVDPQILTLVDTNNNFTASVCPQEVVKVPFGGAIDALACQNEALTNISIENNNVLGLICAETVSANEDGLFDSVSNPDFLQACLMESAEFLQANLTGLLDGTSPILGDTCRFADNGAQCLVNTLQTLPETLFGALELLGCEHPLDPQVCLTSTAEKLASGELLIGGANILTQAICPNATMEAEFDPASGDFTAAFNPQACLTETLSGVGSIFGVAGLEGIDCEPTDPLGCLLNAGDALAPITDLFGDTPLDPSLVTGLLEGLADPANADPLEALTSLLSEIPVLGDILLEAFEQFPGNGGGDGGSPLDQLQGLDALADALENIPVLGDIINGLLEGGMPGGDGGFGPDLLDLLDPSQLGEGAALLEEIPVLGDIIAQLAGALDGDTSDPLAFLTGLGDNLEPLSDVLTQIPVLGDVLDTVIAALLDGGLPEAPGGGGDDPLAPLTSALEQIPVLGDILNEAIATLAGLADGGFDGGGLPFEGGAEQLEQIPVLGELITTLLSGDPSELFDMDGNPLEPLTSLLEPLTGLLGQIPVLGDIIGGLLGGLN